MNSFHDYESLGQVNFNRRKAVLIEAFSGIEVIRWHGRITDQLVNMLEDAEKSRNFVYADKLRKFLEVWRANELTGSINRETLEVLKAAADLLGVDNWNLRTYFSSLATQLKVLIGSEEMLPRDTDMDQNEPFAGTGGAGRGAPPMSPSFGPEGKLGGAPGAGAPPKPGEEGGGSEGAPTPGPGAPPSPEENEEEPPSPANA